MAKVAILLGSTSDQPAMQGCIEYLGHFGIEHELRIISAHRQPEELAAYVKQAEANGFSLIIAAAGMAAHLPGVAAAYTTLAGHWRPSRRLSLARCGCPLRDRPNAGRHPRGNARDRLGGCKKCRRPCRRNHSIERQHAQVETPDVSPERGEVLDGRPLALLPRGK